MSKKHDINSELTEEEVEVQMIQIEEESTEESTEQTNQDLEDKNAEVLKDNKKSKETKDSKKDQSKENDSKKKTKKNENKPNVVAKETKETVSELKKVSWPSFSKVVKKTGVVIAVMIIFTVVLFGIDKLLSLLFDLFTSALSWDRRLLWKC